MVRPKHVCYRDALPKHRESRYSPELREGCANIMVETARPIAVLALEATSTKERLAIESTGGARRIPVIRHRLTLSERVQLPEIGLKLHEVKMATAFLRSGRYDLVSPGQVDDVPIRRAI